MAQELLYAILDEDTEAMEKLFMECPSLLHETIVVNKYVLHSIARKY